MKKALIVGASSDVGVELVKLLINKNYHCYCTYYKNRKKLEIIKKKYPILIDNFKLDFNSTIHIKNFINILKKETNKIDLVILGANIREKRKKFELMDFNSFKTKTFKNIIATVFLVQLIIKYLIKKRKAKIIHISSSASKKGSWGLSGYSSSKAAIDNVLKCLKYEYKQLHIKSVYNFGPVKTRGYIYTNKKIKGKKFKNLLTETKKILSNV